MRKAGISIKRFNPTYSQKEIVGQAQQTDGYFLIILQSRYRWMPEIVFLIPVSPV